MTGKGREKAVAFGGPPETRFRLGVALRRRYDTAARQDGDFRRALEAWSEALLLQPNQYIRRRRVEPEREPDPDGKIARDTDLLIRIETAVAPAFLRPGKAARVHIALRPDPRKDARWNNETPQGLTLWIRSPDGLEIDKRSFSPPDPKEPETREAREVEFEVRMAAEAKPTKVSIPAYALYHVCEGKGGTCRYLRQDFDVVIASKD